MDFLFYPQNPHLARCAAFQSRIHEEAAIIQVTCVQPIYSVTTMTKKIRALIKGRSDAYIDTLTRAILKRKNTIHALFFLAHFSFPRRENRSIMGLLFMGYAVTFFFSPPILDRVDRRIWLLSILWWFGSAVHGKGVARYSQNLIWPHGIVFSFSFPLSLHFSFSGTFPDWK